MLARLYSVTLAGIEGIICEVEVDVARSGMEKSMIVGLPDAAVKESLERVRSAIVNSGFSYPDSQSLVNLAPADIRKVGPAFDLPVALGMLQCSGSLVGENLKKHVIAGELALDGRIRPVNGVLSMAITAERNGFSSIIVPLENAEEAAVVQNIDVYGVGSLSQAAGLLSGTLSLDVTRIDIEKVLTVASEYEVDFTDVKGQESVKRALIIAAAGGHNVMMIGSPGVGKTMLAQRLATILPPLTLEESLETTRIYSSVGLLDKEKALIARRPVRSPHHSASGASLVGGGSVPRPGELSLAHHGILFLDEFGEFPRNILEMIRQPLEDGTATISRARGTVTFPAQFMLVCSMNPCKCGYWGTKSRKCKCSPRQVDQYMSKVSGPLLDRIDIHIDVPYMDFNQLHTGNSQETSAAIRQRVLNARHRQAARFGQGRLVTNATMTHRLVEQHCKLDPMGHEMLRCAMSEFALSARAHDKICKVARTIADLAESEEILPEHIAEAISYRKLDRKL